MPPAPNPILRSALRAPRFLYQWHLGWLLGRRFLMLEHVGRTSGNRHQTVLEVINYNRESSEAVVMSGWGRTSDWYRNIEARGRAKVTVGTRTMDVDASVLDDKDALEAIAAYEKGNRLIRPIVRRVLSRLAGFHYDGTDESRLALIHQLPLVRLTPAAADRR